MEYPNAITVRILKHDGTEHRCWQAKLSGRDEGLLVLDAEFEADVSHNLMGEIKRGTRTIEYYWLDRWYSIFRFLDDEGGTRLWYCNINTPPSFADATLTCIDMDIDVVVQPDLSYSVLDEDEFATNAERYSYSDQEKEHVHAALQELASIIEGRRFPFLAEYSATDKTS
jgi:protein associated with RNAse G/E